MGILDFLGGGKQAGETADKLVNGAISGLDAAWYTDEEKSRTLSSRIAVWIELQKTLASESSARSVNRRVFAWGIVAQIMIFANTALICALMGKTEIVNSITAISEAFYLGWAFCSAVIFYFGPHLASALTGSKK